MYGSLKRGFKLHEYLGDSDFIGNAITVPRYQLYDCGEYPAMVESGVDGNVVTGEVYDVKPETIAVLDEIEGVPEKLYLPQTVQLQTPFESQAVLTYIYQQPVSGFRRISEWPETRRG